MKRIALILLALFAPATLFAQMPQGMDMQKMQKYMACMQGIDQTQLNQLQQDGLQFQEEIKALCTKGERKSAQKKALAFAKETAELPVLKTIQNCTKDVKDMMPGLENQLKQTEGDQHICDKF